MALLQSEPLMGLSARGRTVTFDTPETNGDASNAASRTYNVWDDGTCDVSCVKPI